LIVGNAQAAGVLRSALLLLLLLVNMDFGLGNQGL
jgi:hypothetical protein